MTEDQSGRKRPRKTAPGSRPPTTPDPIELAMEAQARDKASDTPALEVLRSHARLIGWQVANQRASLGLKLLSGTVGIGVAVVLGLVVWQASRAQGLVVDPFSVPPAMAERGLDGASIAALFLDELSQLQAQTDSGRAPSSFRNNWGDDLTVEIAQTGVSVDDVYRMLVGWIGNETRMNGGISQRSDGLSIVVRTGSRPIQAATGDEAELEALLRLAAERVYEQTQPYRYAGLLHSRMRNLPPGPEREELRARRIAILRSLTTSESPVDRAWAFNALGVEEDRPIAELMPLLRAGLAVDPDHPFLLVNMSNSHDSQGQDEAALDWRRRALAAMQRRPADLNPAVIPANEARMRARTAASGGDFILSAEMHGKAAVAANANFSAVTSPPSRAEVLAHAHDPAAAEALLRSLELPDDVAVAARMGPNAMHLPHAAISAERAQWPRVIEALLAADSVYEQRLSRRESIQRQTQLSPRLAYARARTGDLAGAQALIAATPLDCYLCVRERARIAELAGDRPAADRWSAEARRQGPSLPFAFAERGQMLMARGDTAGAIAFYEQAIERGPRWADPQKYWGDALMAQGDEGSAIRKYRAAADRAPQWGALHLAWGRALEADGKRDEARAKYAAAARMDLTVADRAAVLSRLAAVRRGS